MVCDGVKQSKEGRWMPGVKSFFRDLKIPQSPSTSMDTCLEALASWQEPSAKGSARLLKSWLPENLAGGILRKKAAVHLKELFVSHKEQFQETKMELYGKQGAIRYYSVSLLWGQKLYQELRFVLVEMGGAQSIPAIMSLEPEPLAIIRLYSYRFRIECIFRELKQQTREFCYHFWSKYMPKLNCYRKKEEPTLLAPVENEKARKKILEAVRATEMHITLSCIAIGILQSLSIIFMGKVTSSRLRYQRTPSRERVSEGALMHYFRKHFFRFIGQRPELRK